MTTTTTTQIEDSNFLKYPLLLDRIQSSFIDLLFIIALFFAAGILIDRLGEPPVWVRIVLFIGLFFAYEPVCTSYGCTIGNYLKKIRVRQNNNTELRINILQSVIRFAFKLLLGWISFITINFNEERRAIHDFAGGSVMIKIK